MGARIAGYGMDQWQGQVPGYRESVQTKERAGVDGYTFIRQGRRSAPFSIRTVSLHSDIGAARSRARDFETLCGQLVTIEDPGGRSYGPVMVHDVSTQTRRVLYATDGSEAAVEATWQLQRAG